MQSGKVTTLEVLLLFAFMVQLITAQLVPFKSTLDHNDEVMRSGSCEHLFRSCLGNIDAGHLVPVIFGRLCEDLL